MGGGYEIKQITSPVQHAEGPNWCPKSNNLFWVDTFKATLFRLTPDGTTQSYKLEERDSVGFSLPIRDEKDTFLVFADRVVYRLHWPMETNLKPTLTHLTTIENDKPKNQFNDGKADKKGRAWGGTLTRNEDLSVTDHGGSLYVLFNNLTNVHEKIQKTSISNGMAWSKNNKKYYYIDSKNRTVDEYDFDLESSSISNKKVIFDLSYYPELNGIPDGMTIDENDSLWIALFGGHHIIQVNPQNGKIIQKIEMPVTYITSVTFGGPDFNILFAATSRLKSGESESEAGSLYAITGLGVKGFPLHEVVL